MSISINRKAWTAIALVIMLYLIVSKSHAQSSLSESIARGKELYRSECMACHMENGEGIEGAFPPLAGSDYFMDDLSKAVDAILNGLEGELVVNGNSYFGVMDPVPLSDQEVADVLNYIQNSWGGKAEMVTEGEIKEMSN